MNYFFTLLILECKRVLHSPVKLLCAACLLLITMLFGVLLPPDTPASLTVGVFPQGEQAEETMAILEETHDYHIVRYDSLERLKYDIIAGVLHCGYHIYVPGDAEKPVVVYTTENAYLQPLLNQLVLSAYFEANLPEMTQASFEKYGYDGLDGRQAFHEQYLKTNAMTVEVRNLGQSKTAPASTAQSLQPLVYAVLVSLLIVAALLQTLLTPKRLANSHRQLTALSGHRFASLFAPLCAEAGFWTFTLFLCDLILGSIFGDNLYYPLISRILLLPVLAVGATLVSFGAMTVRKGTAIILACLPPWLLISILFSGALFPPEQFPYSLGFLRFFSPAWYALSWMNLF